MLVKGDITAVDLSATWFAVPSDSWLDLEGLPQEWADPEDAGNLLVNLADQEKAG